MLKNSVFRFTEESEISKRIYFAGCAVNAIEYSLKKEHGQAEELISRLKLYFTVTRDPFLTIFEVRCLLYASFILLDKMNLFNQYSEELDKLIPNCPVKPEPRMLAHHARCQIRDNLKASDYALPIAVEKLGLPKILKNFVLGDVFDISVRKRNASSQNSVTKTELARLLFQ